MLLLVAVIVQTTELSVDEEHEGQTKLKEELNWENEVRSHVCVFAQLEVIDLSAQTSVRLQINDSGRLD